MTQWQLEGFRRSLEGLLRQTLVESDQLSQALSWTDHLGADESDRATLEAERNLLLAQAERQHRLCKEVILALCRVEQGRYGFCDECGEPIGIRRLEARPTARLCRQCQEEMEARRVS
jgi:DnaK suppressor protein